MYSCICHLDRCICFHNLSQNEKESWIKNNGKNNRCYAPPQTISNQQHPNNNEAVSSLKHLHFSFPTALSSTPSGPLTCICYHLLYLLLTLLTQVSYLTNPRKYSVICASSVSIWMMLTTTNKVCKTWADTLNAMLWNLLRLVYKLM